jgi:hypothetical protein
MLVVVMWFVFHVKTPSVVLVVLVVLGLPLLGIPTAVTSVFVFSVVMPSAVFTPRGVDSHI